MSSLQYGEQETIEKLFGMGSGYVLKFSDRTFKDFFWTTAKIDIYSPKYEGNGTSKAKRLRSFWKQEEDYFVGKILHELLAIWDMETAEGDKTSLHQERIMGNKIVERLLGKQLLYGYGERKENHVPFFGLHPDFGNKELSQRENIEQVKLQHDNKAPKYNPENEFLRFQFQDVTFDKLPLDDALISILKSRLNEAKSCLTNAPLATVILCGSILEGILSGSAHKNPQRFCQSASAPKKDGKVKPLQEWTLTEFIDVAHGLNMLGLDTKHFSHTLRDFRNYIHPYQQLKSQFTPTRHTAEICLQVLKSAIYDLSGGRDNNP